MHLAIRADGGPEIGYGHLVRTSALATEALRRGHGVTYATTTPGPVTEVCPSDIETIALPSRTDASSFVHWLNGEADVTLLDSYLADEEYQRAVKEVVPLALVSDDTRHPICADVVINGNLYAPALDYDVLGDDPVWCLGPEYLLLRDSIRRLAAHDPPWRDDPERALITMGGSDMAGLTPTVIRAFDEFDIQVDAIVGPGFSEGQEQDIRDAAINVSAEVRVARDPDDLAERMLKADFAVSTASSSTYELLALGTPIVSRSVVDNQDPIAAALRERDAATVLGRDDGEKAFGRAITGYMADAALRRERRELGRSLVDGQGAERIAEIIGRL